MSTVFRVDDEIKKAGDALTGQHAAAATSQSYLNNYLQKANDSFAQIAKKWMLPGTSPAQLKTEQDLIDAVSGIKSYGYTQDADAFEKAFVTPYKEENKKFKSLSNYTTLDNNLSKLKSQKAVIDPNIESAQKSVADLFAANPETIFDPYQQNYISGYLGRLDQFRPEAEQQAKFASYRQGVSDGSVSRQVNPTVQGIYDTAKKKYTDEGDSVFSAIKGDYRNTQNDYATRYSSPTFDQMPALNPLFPALETSNANNAINTLRTRASDILPNINGMTNPFLGAKIGAQLPTIRAQTAAASPITGVNIQNPYQPIIPQSNKIFPNFTGAQTSGQSSSFVK
jgi:hypothetical protein